MVAYMRNYPALVDDPCWAPRLHDAGTENWETQWVLDGEKATVRNSADGMVFAAGPVPGEDASHAVLWTKASFEGDIKIECDYTRLDASIRDVNLFYIQATGIGVPPYDADILRWGELRRIPAMREYFQKMNLVHLSFAAHAKAGDAVDDYVRARKYPTNERRPFRATEVAPSYERTGLFLPGVLHRFIVVRSGEELFFHVSNESTEKLFRWKLGPECPPPTGRFGIRHMAARASRYANIRISTK